MREDKVRVAELTAALTEQTLKLRSDVAQLAIEKEALREVAAYEDIVNGLKTQVSDLQIQESKIREAHERDKRELEHMIGLERQRQVQEVAAERREVTVQLREENLQKDKDRFTETLAFHEERFQSEMENMRKFLGSIMARLPEINVKVRGDVG